MATCTPLARLMVCGIDTYHEGKGTSRANSVGAFVASLDKYCYPQSCGFSHTLGFIYLEGKTLFIDGGSERSIYYSSKLPTPDSCVFKKHKAKDNSTNALRLVIALSKRHTRLMYL